MRALAIKVSASSARGPERPRSLCSGNVRPYATAQGTDEWRVVVLCGAPHEVWHQHPFQVNAPVSSMLDCSKWLADERSCSHREQRCLRGDAERALPFDGDRHACAACHVHGLSGNRRDSKKFPKRCRGGAGAGASAECGGKCVIRPRAPAPTVHLSVTILVDPSGGCEFRTISPSLIVPLVRPLCCGLD